MKRQLKELLLAAAVANLTLLATAGTAAPDPTAAGGAASLFVGLLLVLGSPLKRPEAPVRRLGLRTSDSAAAARRSDPSVATDFRMAGSRPGF